VSTSASSPPPPAGDRPSTPAAAAGPFAGLTRNVVALGAVSLLTDVSSEMIVPVLPLFVTATLGASVASMGMIEGVAECTASVLRLGSGWLSDRIGRRKPFIAFGYGLSAAAKGALALAASWPAVLGLRFADRVGKGLRNPPRDALIADSVAAGVRGRAFGFHRAMDTLGAAIGPLAAFALLRGRPADLRRVFAWSVVPATLALVVIAAFVRAPRRAPTERRSLGREWGALGGPFRRFLAADAVFQLGNSSMAFVLLKTRAVGFGPGQVALVYCGYNIVYALLSLPAGVLSDRIGRRPLLIAGYALYAAVYALLAVTSSRAGVVAAFLLYGVQSALMDGQQRSLLADLVPADRRATAYGAYYTVVGAALLPASVIAGLAWQRFGPAATFGIAAALALAAAALFVTLLPAREEHQDRHVG
jgi:MFS family permease